MDNKTIRRTFQFHLVRLKVLWRILVPWLLPLFQFHLVRLKVWSLECSTRETLPISIPFSTIKRKLPDIFLAYAQAYFNSI